MTVDDVITRITKAPSYEVANAIMRTVPRKMLLEVADQLHIETEGHGLQTIRTAVIKEARA